jgi:hypothetical protein
MIISHKHKFIFFAIPKTGTHSIRFALRPFLGIEDEEHVALFHESKLKIDAFNDRINGHISVKEIKPHLSEEIWNSYFKFTFVRNPWDRFISIIVFKNHNLEKFPDLVDAFAKKKLENEAISPSDFFKPQADYVIDDNKVQALDFIGKTENMQADFDTICDRIGINRIQLDQKNKSQHDNYKRYYNDELKERLAHIYADDIKLFKYSF